MADCLDLKPYDIFVIAFIGYLEKIRATLRSDTKIEVALAV